jgi:hypothetical protein
MVLEAQAPAPFVVMYSTDTAGSKPANQSLE